MSYVPTHFTTGVVTGANDVIPQGPKHEWRIVTLAGLTGPTGATAQFFVESLCGNPADTVAQMQRATPVDPNFRDQWTRTLTAVGPPPVWGPWVLTGLGATGSAGPTGPSAGPTGPTGGVGPTGPGFTGIFIWSGLLPGFTTANLGWGTTTSNPESFTQMLMPRALTIYNLRVNLTVAPGGTGSRDVTIRVNGVDTPLTVTLGPSDTTADNLVDTVSVTTRDLLSLQEVASGTVQTCSLHASCEYTG